MAAAIFIMAMLVLSSIGFEVLLRIPSSTSHVGSAPEDGESPQVTESVAVRTGTGGID
ncbi:hypothetical protein SAMN05421505_112211 [Sinosporangium album]|uniref:Uncharacterized protein n=1 Tax=Sinosporangium album TaxID=504805 RepID=A0A1G8AL67_9ACTN|nr:hypothetical protein [Sinosporangium album]SDH21701.1 hypothetical protein SAMN05421505_112211 [Sinosporangium album]